MKFMHILIGLLVVIIGGLPFLKQFNLMPESLNFIPVGGWQYQLMIIGIGLLSIIFGVKIART